jgi:hypothetical protein
MSIIEKCDQDQFANDQSSCDLQVNSDLVKPGTERDVEATEQHPGVGPDEFPAPIGKLLGLKLLQAENGMAVVEFVADERHANPMLEAYCADRLVDEIAPALFETEDMRAGVTGLLEHGSRQFRDKVILQGR